MSRPSKSAAEIPKAKKHVHEPSRGLLAVDFCSGCGQHIERRSGKWEVVR